MCLRAWYKWANTRHKNYTTRYDGIYCAVRAINQSHARNFTANEIGTAGERLPLKAPLKLEI